MGPGWDRIWWQNIFGDTGTCTSVHFTSQETQCTLSPNQTLRCSKLAGAAAAHCTLAFLTCGCGRRLKLQGAGAADASPVFRRENIWLDELLSGYTNAASTVPSSPSRAILPGQPHLFNCVHLRRSAYEISHRHTRDDPVPPPKMVRRTTQPDTSCWRTPRAPRANAGRPQRQASHYDKTAS